MGIANQLLAVIALAVGTTYLLVHAPKRSYALCTAIPLVFVVATVFTAGVRASANGCESWPPGTFNWPIRPSVPGRNHAVLVRLTWSGGSDAGLVGVDRARRVRRWYVLLVDGVPQAGSELAAEELGCTAMLEHRAVRPLAAGS